MRFYDSMWAIDTVGHIESCLARALLLARGLRECVVEVRGNMEGERAFAVGICVFPILIWQIDTKELAPSIESLMQSSILGARLGLGDSALRRRDISYRLQRAVFPLFNPDNRDLFEWWDTTMSSSLGAELSKKLGQKPDMVEAIATINGDVLDGLREAWETDHSVRWPCYAILDV